MKFHRKFMIFFIFCILPIKTKEYRILGVFPYPAKSHNIFCQSLMTILAKRGHQVDVIATNELENHPENYTTILNLSDIIPFTINDLSLKRVITGHGKDMLKYFSLNVGNTFCDLMANEKMQEIFKKLKNGPAYDLFITEAFSMSCYMGLAQYLNVPLITLSPQILFPWIEESIGNPISAAYRSNFFSKTTEITSFWDYLQNAVQNIIIKYRFNYYTNTKQTETMRKYLSKDLPNVREILKSSALTLVNTHHSFNGISPFTTSLIEVGGIHILEDETKLTPELQKWMDESDGVVYFSLGSIVAIETLPKENILAFFSSFAKLNPIRVLIRIRDSKVLPSGLPKNVKISPWIPQIPVLRHKNTRVFITHCGLLSSQEAFHFGIPVIGIPLLLDQFSNANVFVKKNIGMKIDLENISEKNLDEALNCLLYNSTYRKAAKRESKLFQDRPMTAKDTAIFWIEYIARNGENILRPPSDLHWIQNELLHVYGFLILPLVLLLYLITKVVKAFQTFIIKILFLKLKTIIKSEKNQTRIRLEKKKKF